MEIMGYIWKHFLLIWIRLIWYVLTVDPIFVFLWQRNIDWFVLKFHSYPGPIYIQPFVFSKRLDFNHYYSPTAPNSSQRTRPRPRVKNWYHLRLKAAERGLVLLVTDVKFPAGWRGWDNLAHSCWLFFDKNPEVLVFLAGIIQFTMFFFFGKSMCWCYCMLLIDFEGFPENN